MRKRNLKFGPIPWGLVSQIMSSGTNFTVLVALARQQGVQDFGWSALTIAVVTALVGVCRSVFGTAVALSSRPDGLLTEEARYGPTLSAIAVTVVALPGAATMLLLGDATAAMALLVAPAIVMHDMLRQTCFSVQRERFAAFGDALRLGIGILVIPFSSRFDFLGWMVVLAWGGSAVVGAFFLGKSTSWRWLPFDRLRYLSIHSARSRMDLLGDSVLIQFTPIVTAAIVGAKLGAPALSGYRGASAVLGPVSVFLTAIPLLTLPKLAREGFSSSRSAMRLMAPNSAVLSAFCVVLAILSIYIPDSSGEALLGASWAATIPVLPLLSLQFALQPWSIQASTTLKFLGRTSTLVKLRVARSFLVVTVVLCGSQFATLRGVVFGIICTEAAMTLTYILAAYRVDAGRHGYDITARFGRLKRVGRRG